MAQHTPSASSANPIDRSAALYERVPMAVGDQHTFTEVKQAVETSFAVGNVATFLKSVQRAALRIRDFAARGFAAGIASHGIGTARAFTVDPLAGAFAGIVMGLNAFATPIMVPLILPWLIR